MIRKEQGEENPAKLQRAAEELGDIWLNPETRPQQVPVSLRALGERWGEADDPANPQGNVLHKQVGAVTQALGRNVNVAQHIGVRG